jgi:Inositol monophosphatase family
MPVDLLVVAVAAAHEAGAVLLRRARDPVSVTERGRRGAWLQTPTAPPNVLRLVAEPERDRTVPRSASRAPSAWPMRWSAPAFSHPISTERKRFAAMSDRAQAVRRDGSAALDLAFVACGRFDGFWEFDLKPWDVAVGTLIVREAGGLISILATNGRIQEEMELIFSSSG